VELSITSDRKKKPKAEEFRNGAPRRSAIIAIRDVIIEMYTRFFVAGDSSDGLSSERVSAPCK